MLKRVITTITTAADGSATVFLGNRLTGWLVALIYRPGTMDTGADLTITTQWNPAVTPAGGLPTGGIPILTKVNLGTGNSYLFPRALPTNANSATGPLGTVPSERIPLSEDKIKVVVAQGGNTLTGTIEAIYEVDEPI